MKKVLSMLLMLSLIGTMLFGLSACGPKDKEVVETPPVSTVEPTAPIEPSEDVDNTDDVILEEVSISNIVDTLKALYGENYLPNMELDAEAFESLTGVTSDMYSEFYGAVPMISAQVDSLLIAKSEDTSAVESAFLAYRDKLLNDSVQYPVNQPKVAASTVVTFDDYVIFMMLGGYHENNEATEGELSTFCADQTTLGVESLEKLFTEGYVPVDNIEVAGDKVEPDTNGSVEILLPETPDVSGDVVVGEPEGEPVDDNMLIDSEEVVPEMPVVSDDTRVDTNNTSDFE